MTACANKRCSIGWNPSSSQYSMMLASDIGEGSQQRMHYARFGRRFKAGRSGSKELIEELNPLLRGWGEYYKRARIRKLFQRLDGWVRRRIWSHRYKCWRNAGWKRLPTAQLYGEYELVRLIDLIPSLASRHS